MIALIFLCVFFVRTSIALPQFGYVDYGVMALGRPAGISAGIRVPMNMGMRTGVVPSLPFAMGAGYGHLGGAGGFGGTDTMDYNAALRGIGTGTLPVPSAYPWRHVSAPDTKLLGLGAGGMVPGPALQIDENVNENANTNVNANTNLNGSSFRRSFHKPNNENFNSNTNVNTNFNYVR